jgi:dipeptidyl aminopeptidase/acylaminoacyl peptidase
MRHHRIFLLALSLWLPACGGSADTKETTTPTPLDVVDDSSATPPTEAVGTPSADRIPRTVFFGNPDKASPKLSPDGTQLAYLAERDGVLNVWVAPIGKLDAAKAVTADKTRPVRSFFWAHDNQHMLYMQDAGGDENWHVFSVNLSTGKTIDLTPMKKIAAQVSGVSDKHPTKVIIGINDRNPQLHDLYTVDITNGEKVLLQANPGFVDIGTDDDFKVRYAMAMAPDGGFHVMVPKSGKSKAKPAKTAAKTPPDPMADWELFMAIPQEDALTTNLLSFDKSGKKLYLWDSRNRDRSALMLMDMKSKKQKLIAEHAKADGEAVGFHPKTKKPMAAVFNYARRELKILDKSIQKDFDKLKTISDGEPNVVSVSHDGNTWIVAYNDDDGPVKYYLWDHKKRKEEFLFTNRKELEGLPLSKMHARVIESRDGMELVNYLSLPAESDPDADGKPMQALPMVLLVHGGPWGRDSWGYNSLHQLLTNRGYAVLSVNFRGSTGFGKKFINAANLEWAGKMHDDLLDSVDWATAQGIAQADKVCIMGGSYGGYATLVGLTFTPNKFACGVDIVGPSNIITLLEAIPPYWKPMQDMFKARVGDWTTPEGIKMLKERSPLNKVAQIVRPLLIGQGANDPRVKQAEADQIVEAMKQRDIPVSYVLFPDEGHGFHRPPNNLAFWAATEAFLSAHLGGTYQPAEASEFKGSTLQVPTGVHGIPGFTALVEARAK